MPTYVLLSNLTDEGAKALKTNPKRLQEVNKEIEKFGAKVTAQYAVLGPYDFVSIVDCPDNQTIARVSVELASRGSIRLMTLAATPVANYIRTLKTKDWRRRDMPRRGLSERSGRAVSAATTFGCSGGTDGSNPGI